MNTEDIKDEEVKNTPEVEKTTAEATAEANTPAEETAEDLLAKEKDKYLRLFAEFRTTKNAQLKSVLSYLKLPEKTFCQLCCP